jgi:hypothetical protein
MMNTNRTIFLVEDDDLDAELVLRAFQRAKVTNALVQVRDGMEALDYLWHMVNMQHGARQWRQNWRRKMVTAGSHLQAEILRVRPSRAGPQVNAPL